MSKLNVTKFKSKLEVDELFVKSPINLKCVLSQNERDFLEAVIHLQSTGKYFTSDWRTEGLKHLEYKIWWAVSRLTSLLDVLPHKRTELGLWNSETAPALYLKQGILES